MSAPTFALNRSKDSRFTRLVYYLRDGKRGKNLGVTFSPPTAYNNSKARRQAYFISADMTESKSVGNGRLNGADSYKPNEAEDNALG